MIFWNHVSAMNKKIFFVCSLILFCVTVLYGQVTIGVAEKPTSGALLQLKDGTVDANSPLVNARAGLGMPRVSLNSLKPEKGKLGESIGNQPSVNAWDEDEHIGLLVYNSRFDECDATPIAMGLYVWSGSEWLNLGADYSAKPLENINSFVDSRDGEIYLFRKFGEAGDWMLQNLRYVPKSKDGYNDYSHSGVNSITNKNYTYSEGNENPYIIEKHPSSEWSTVKKRNGILYNWGAATNGQNLSLQDQGQTSTGTDPIITSIQGVCPIGWHLPSDKEWNDLEREIFTNAHLYSDYEKAETELWGRWQPNWETAKGYRPLGPPMHAQGAAMKSVCAPIGSKRTTRGKSLSGSYGGFDVLLTGCLSSSYTTLYGEYSYHWTSSSATSSNAWSRRIFDYAGHVSRDDFNKYYQFSVRCKKDK